MVGEFALALSPIDFQAIVTETLSEALETAALIRFEVANAMEGISYSSGQGEACDLEELTGTGAYLPGYLILGDHLIIATTKSTLEMLGSIDEGREKSLAKESRYSRLVNEVPGTRTPLVYVNIREIRESVVAALEMDD